KGGEQDREDSQQDRIRGPWQRSLPRSALRRAVLSANEATALSAGRAAGRRKRCRFLTAILLGPWRGWSTVPRQAPRRAGLSVTARPRPLDAAVAVGEGLCDAGPHTIPYRLSQRASDTAVEFFCCQFTERLVDVGSVISGFHDVCSLYAGSTRRPNVYDGGARAVREGRHKRGLGLVVSASKPSPA